MRSIQFEEVNTVVAENQSDFDTIHVYYNEEENSLTACFQFSDEEIKEFLKTKKIWYKQFMYGKDGSLQPLILSTKKEDFIKTDDIIT